ncbi:MAG: hypothetical protein ACI9BH_002572 [Paracoccaceae bacterium]|jgi:hypothetical protein
MADADGPMGQLYSLVYLRTDEVLKDDGRMRFRLRKVFSEFAPLGRDRSTTFGAFVEAELGVRVLNKNGPIAYVHFDDITANFEIRDLLSMITLLFRFLPSNGSNSAAVKMLLTTRRIFAETQVGYTIDDAGGVHPAFDAAFEGVRESAIRGLGGGAYNLKRQFIDAAEKALMADPIDGRQAIRNIFEAVENLYKQMYPKVTQLNSGSIMNDFRPEIGASLEGRSTAKRSALKQADSFKSWTDSAHFHRHAPGQPGLEQPLDELAILAVSQGFGFLRWLVTVQQQRG